MKDTLVLASSLTGICVSGWISAYGYHLMYEIWNIDGTVWWHAPLELTLSVMCLALTLALFVGPFIWDMKREKA